VQLLNIARNSIAQWRHPEAKIFFLGFNKTATSTTHFFLRGQGIRSVHYNHGFLARQIEISVSDRDELRRLLRRWTAYSDMSYFSETVVIEGNRHFRLFHELFPDAYFVLNDREVESWIKSRETHRTGHLTKRLIAYYKTDLEGLRLLLRDMHESHREAVTSYFAGNPKFLHFWVDRDTPRTLTDFLAPTYTLDPKEWGHRHRSTDEKRRAAEASLADT
jgi:hypothetical protein